MSETQEIVQKSIGYSWHISIKKTTRTPKEGSKYDDVTEAEAALNGHEDTKIDAEPALTGAKTQIETLLAEED